MQGKELLKMPQKLSSVAVKTKAFKVNVSIFIYILTLYKPGSFAFIAPLS